MAGSQKTETLQKPTEIKKLDRTVQTLAKAAIQEGADPALALQIAAEAAAHQPGGHLHNQEED